MKKTTRKLLKEYLSAWVMFMCVCLMVLIVVVSIQWLDSGRMSPWALFGVIPVISIIWAIMITTLEAMDEKEK